MDIDEIIKRFTQYYYYYSTKDNLDNEDIIAYNTEYIEKILSELLEKKDSSQLIVTSKSITSIALCH